MKPKKTGHPLYMTFPDCSGLFTDSVWQGLVFYRATGKDQSFKVGSGQNQSKPDAEKQTRDRLVRPDFMYQTDTRKSLVFAFGTRFGLCQVIATSPPRWPLSRALGRYGHMWLDWPGKPATRQTCASGGVDKGDTPSKCRTVRNDEGVSRQLFHC